MATFGQTYPTLIDIAKRLNPDGTVAQPAELLAQANEILEDAPMLEGNLPTGHRETQRTGLPSVFYRQFNRGTPNSKSRTMQVTDTIGMLEARSHVDAKLAQLNGNSASWRMSEEYPFMEAMSQTKARTMFYGNENVNPQEFTGLAARYNDLSAPNGQNIIDAGGTTGQLTSIWLVCWGEQTVNMRYPKGMSESGGIRMQDLGEQDEFDENGDRFRALQTLWQWDCGLSLKDWRYVVRIANIPVALLEDDGATYDLWNLLIKAQHKLFNKRMGRCYYYMNRTVEQYLDLQSFNKQNIQITQQEVNGEIVDSFRKMPFRTCDVLTNNETRVVAS